MSTDYSLTYNDEVFPLVLAYEFFLILFVVCKFLLKRHFFMLDP